MKTRFVYPSKSTHNSKLSQTGFTIVELLVVIVVIAILAAITIVSYTGITSKATASALQSDLDNASRQLKLYYVDNGSYPTSLSSNCPVPADTRYCLKPSPGNTFTYTNLLGTSFKLIATKDTTSYYTTSDTSPNNKNLLYLMAGDNASFEGGTVGGWTHGGDAGDTEISSAWSTHGSKSWHNYDTVSAAAYWILDVTAITVAGGTYTVSMSAKAVVNGVKVGFDDDTMSPQYGNTIAVGTEGVSKVTVTFGGGSTQRLIYIGFASGGNPFDYYVDAIQLESGSVATPF